MAYTPTTWKDGDIITADKMNHLESGVENEQIGPQGPVGPQGAQGPTGPAGAKGDPGQNATINGVNTLEIVAGDNISIEQQGTTLTISASGGGDPGESHVYQIGDIMFSASQDVGPEWLRCNGEFISETQYPELVAALGKLTPSGDKFTLISDGEIGTQPTNGVVYSGRMWTYSFTEKKLYGVDLEGTQATKVIPVSSTETGFNNFLAPTSKIPLCLSIVPYSDTQVKIFLTQIIQSGSYSYKLTTGNFESYVLIYDSDFTGDESSITLSRSITTLTEDCDGFPFITCVPYVTTHELNGATNYVCVIRPPTHNPIGLSFLNGSGKFVDFVSGSGSSEAYFQRSSFSRKNKGEYVDATNAYVSSCYIYSATKGIFTNTQISGTQNNTAIKSITKDDIPIPICGNDKFVTSYNLSRILYMSLVGASTSGSVNIGLSLPVYATNFVDAAAYLWNKEIYMFFVGTGIIFSRTLAANSFGYLDTTDVLGVINQFGYLDYSDDGNTLYLLGQDTDNKVKVAKMELNTLYNYANDGAWLPLIASDGVPAYIKATNSSAT